MPTPSNTRLSSTLKQDWLDQSTRDLALARIALENGYSEWACYLSQQSSEKAVKAVFFALETHWPSQFSVHDLLSLSRYIPKKFLNSVDLIEFENACNRFADGEMHNAPRYPRVVPPGSMPNAIFTNTKATQAINDAEEILKAVGVILANV